jgi:hypothetical protein
VLGRIEEGRRERERERKSAVEWRAPTFEKRQAAKKPKKGTASFYVTI